MPAAHHIEQMRLNMEYLGLNLDSLNEIWSTSYLFLGFKVQVMCFSRGGGRGRTLLRCREVQTHSPVLPPTPALSPQPSRAECGSTGACSLPPLILRNLYKVEDCVSVGAVF